MHSHFVRCPLIAHAQRAATVSFEHAANLLPSLTPHLDAASVALAMSLTSMRSHASLTVAFSCRNIVSTVTCSATVMCLPGEGRADRGMAASQEGDTHDAKYATQTTRSDAWELNINNAKRNIQFHFGT